MAKRSIWTAHPHLAWAMWGLDEIEATVASIEGHLHGRADVRPEAHSAVADMRTARDAFRKSIEEHAHVDEAVFARTKAALEGQWAVFEDSVKDYLETVGKQVAEQETVFRARADAQGKLGSTQSTDCMKARRTSLPIHVATSKPPSNAWRPKPTRRRSGSIH